MSIYLLNREYSKYNHSVGHLIASIIYLNIRGDIHTQTAMQNVIMTFKI